MNTGFGYAKTRAPKGARVVHWLSLRIAALAASAKCVDELNEVVAVDDIVEVDIGDWID